MGEKTKIAWCHHTFNAWWGCHKVSPACKNCYAETFSKRTGHGVWGADAPRRFFVDKHWREPLKWNRDAIGRERVFCGSMMDVFELHEDHAVRELQDAARRRLWALIEQTTALDWLLLTKRPENFALVAPSRWLDACPPNVWAGTTVENQEYADLRIPHLLKVPARVRFLSCEPLLGPIDLAPWLKLPEPSNMGGHYYPGVAAEEAGGLDAFYTSDCAHGCGAWMGGSRSGGPDGSRPDDHEAPFGACPKNRPALSWIIAGGESGHHSREHQLEWSRSLRDQCAAAGVAFFFKQTGERATTVQWNADDAGRGHGPRHVPLALAPRSKGESLDEIPPDLRIREFPTPRAA